MNDWLKLKRPFIISCRTALGAPSAPSTTSARTAMLSPSTSSWKLQVAVSRSTPVQRWSKCRVTLGSFSASVSSTLFSSPRLTLWMARSSMLYGSLVSLPSRSCVMRAYTGTTMRCTASSTPAARRAVQPRWLTTRLMLRPA